MQFKNETSRNKSENNFIFTYSESARPSCSKSYGLLREISRNYSFLKIVKSGVNRNTDMIGTIPRRISGRIHIVSGVQLKSDFRHSIRIPIYCSLLFYSLQIYFQ